MISLHGQFGDGPFGEGPEAKVYFGDRFEWWVSDSMKSEDGEGMTLLDCVLMRMIGEPRPHLVPELAEFSRLAMRVWYRSV